VNEAELLFSSVLNCNRMSLYLDRQRLLTGDESKAISAALKRRIAGEPLEYILASTEFMGLEFKLSPDVLIPRPETEILVETAIRLASTTPCSKQGRVAVNTRILDLGTGSGCIAVSLAKFLPDAEITAVDISQEALKVAAENAEAHNVKINFIRSDLFSSPALSSFKYEIIVSNPPYIVSEEIERLQPELSYEPRVALDAGPDGLEFYRRIADKAPDHLEKGGFLVMEMGFGQSKAVENIFNKSKKFEIIEIVKDYNNIDRVIVARRQTSG
jgi:release factor glutamine methyltransferase